MPSDGLASTGRSNEDKRPRVLPSAPAGDAADSILHRAVDFVDELAQRYEISSLAPLLASCRSALSQNEVNVAVVGRFKAGKSSFLNHFVSRPLLPVGVVPVTAVVTEIRFGPVEKAEVHFLDGRVQEIPVDAIATYVSERDNPENTKRVERIAVELPALERFRGLTFVDTPGLESALAHNTEEALKWLPSVGMALVAVSVDPPLSRRDIELVKKLYRFTPNVTILLTKVDLLAPADRLEVVGFVTEQLAKAFEKAPQVIPYSILPGYEDLKASLKQDTFQPVLAKFEEQRSAIIGRKIESLLDDCSGYVTLSLKSAELLSDDRAALKEQLIGQEQGISDVKSQLRLIARHASAGTRTFAEGRFQNHQKDIERRLLNDLAAEFPEWTTSLASLLGSFDVWLNFALADQLAAISTAERSKLCEPLGRVAAQILRALQDFRDRLADRAMRAFATPLRTTEVEIEIREPSTPDIRIGNIFDRNWELLSPIVPVVLIKGIVRRHFERQVAYKLSTNLSRLASQWEETINAALLNVETEAERRLDGLVATVRRLIETGEGTRLPEIRQDLEKIASLRRAIAGIP